MSGRKVVSAAFKTARMSMNTAKSLNTKASPLLLWKVSNFEYEESPYPATKIRVPGLSHESFDRDANPKITSIMITSVLARAAALHRPLPIPNHVSDSSNGETEGNEQGEERTFLDYQHLSDEFYTFMSSTEFVMSRTMYDNTVPKWPVDMKFTLGYVGNCSVANICEYYACDEQESNAPRAQQTPLWTNTYQIVSVDKKTRKPVKLPDWFRDKYKDKGCMDKGFIVKPFERPAVTYAQPSTVQWSDTDNYKHTNFTTYIRWALDALHAALRFRDSTTNQASPVGTSNGVGPEEWSGQERAASSALRGITKEIISSGLHKLHVTYMRECLEGESVETHVWQDGTEKGLVWFSVVKAGEDVCQMKMWYFTDDDEEEYPI